MTLQCKENGDPIRPKLLLLNDSEKKGRTEDDVKAENFKRKQKYLADLEEYEKWANTKATERAKKSKQQAAQAEHRALRKEHDSNYNYKTMIIGRYILATTGMIDKILDAGLQKQLTTDRDRELFGLKPLSMQTSQQTIQQSQPQSQPQQQATKQ